MLTKIFKWLCENDEDAAAAAVVVAAGGGAVAAVVAGAAVAAAVVAAGAAVAAAVAAAVVAGAAVAVVAGAAVAAAVGAYIITFGFVFGLINLNYLIPLNIFTIISLIVVMLALAEFLFGFNKKEKKIKWGKVIWLKIDAILTSSMIIINLLNIIWLIRKIRINFNVFLRWTGYIGAGLIALLIVGGLIYLWLLWNKNRLTIKKKVKK